MVKVFWALEELRKPNMTREQIDRVGRVLRDEEPLPREVTTPTIEQFSAMLDGAESRSEEAT